jgi:hypothetical protein
MGKPDLEFQRDWAALQAALKEQFGEHPELEAILLLVGIQEIGKGPLKLNKQQKMDVIHVAVCSLLIPYNYYQFIGRDEEGWPHFEATENLPSLKPIQQQRLIKEALIDYFKPLETSFRKRFSKD